MAVKRNSKRTSTGLGVGKRRKKTVGSGSTLKTAARRKTASPKKTMSRGKSTTKRGKTSTAGRGSSGRGLKRSTNKTGSKASTARRQTTRGKASATRKNTLSLGRRRVAPITKKKVLSSRLKKKPTKKGLKSSSGVSRVEKTAGRKKPTGKSATARYRMIQPKKKGKKQKKSGSQDFATLKEPYLAEAKVEKQSRVPEPTEGCSLPEKIELSSIDLEDISELEIAPYEEEGLKEEYMNPKQREHFRRLLLKTKCKLLKGMTRTVHHLQDEAVPLSDPNDRATVEQEVTSELRTRDRERKLIKKIETALRQLGEGRYGYCSSCGVEIGIRRLEARPTATLCIDCKTLDEIREKQMGG